RPQSARRLTRFASSCPERCYVVGVSDDVPSAALDQRVVEFADSYEFGLDEYQLDGCQALAEGGGVLVAAPTGAGKTVIGEFAVFLAVQESRKCFYTTPIKALSNQKYHDLVESYGAERVGLLTGDSSVNPDAQIVVMT